MDTSIASVDLADILFDDFQGGSILLSEAKEGQIEFLRDAIKPIYEPEYGPVSAGEWLDDADLVIGYESDSGTFAYPLRLLDAHEIVNDLVDGVPVAVTYCPLCHSGSCTAAIWTAGPWCSATPAPCTSPTWSSMTTRPAHTGSRYLARQWWAPLQARGCGCSRRRPSPGVSG